MGSKRSGEWKIALAMGISLLAIILALSIASDSSSKPDPKQTEEPDRRN